MDKIIDMHTHTSYSDGELSPTKLIKKAINSNIGVLSITDHDTLDGIKKVDKNSSLITSSGIKIINGIELSAKVPTGRMHILGYDFDLNNESLNKKMVELKDNKLDKISGGGIEWVGIGIGISALIVFIAGVIEYKPMDIKTSAEEME